MYEKSKCAGMSGICPYSRFIVATSNTLIWSTSSLPHSVKAFASWAKILSCFKHDLAQSDEEFTRGSLFVQSPCRTSSGVCTRLPRCQPPNGKWQGGWDSHQDTIKASSRQPQKEISRIWESQISRYAISMARASGRHRILIMYNLGITLRPEMSAYGTCICCSAMTSPLEPLRRHTIIL